MTNQEKEIQAVYIKYAKQGRKDCKDMTIEEEKQYIDKMEPKMKKELQNIIEKYKQDAK